ncbi:MAG: hypothetical protein ABI068_01075 [Ktedonobacterales bacterium]
MFCPTCGAEAAEETVVCATCGDYLPLYSRPVATLTAPLLTSQATDLPPPPAAPLVVMRGADGSDAHAHHAFASAAFSELSVSPGGVGWLANAPSLPRDAAGRIALLAAVALTANAFFTPWVIANGHHITPAHIRAFSLGMGALMALVAVPICWPRLRSRPAWAVAPLVIGACCFGAAALAWLAVGPLGSRLVADALGEIAASGISFASNSDGTLARGPLLTIAPDIGLTIFLVSSAVLLAAGYRLFVEALRHTR